MNQIIMILLISVLILVHEIGHFVAARLCGIRVTRFGIGMPFGPSWKMFSWKNTDFYIHAFLFGGYVSFPDDEPPVPSELSSQGELSERRDGHKVCDARDGDALSISGQGETVPEKQGADDSQANASRAKVCDARDGDALSISGQGETVPASGEPTEPPAPVPENELYDSKTIAQKLFVVSAGVLMNIIFAIFLVLFCALFYHKLPTSTQNIYINGFSSKPTSDILEKGALKNDKFIKMNNQKINSFYQLSFFTQNSKLFDDYAQKDLYEQNLAELKKLNPKIQNSIKKDEIILLPAPEPENPLQVNENVLKGLEKYKKDGIELTKTQIQLRNKIYNKKEFKADADITLDDLALSLSDSYKPLNITFLRDGREIEIKNVKINETGLLGVMLDIEDIYAEVNNFKDALVKSCDYLYTTTTTMLLGLWQLVTGKISGSDMHGVIAIVKVGGDIIASKGMLNGILLTAMISINLAIMNFLPIPALDGGHVMFLLIEKLTGKKPSKEFGEKITNFFFFLLILLMVVICYNDILGLVTKKF